MSSGSIVKHILYVIGLACVCMGCGELRPTHEDAKLAFAELVKVQEAHQQAISEIALEHGPQYEAIIASDTALVLSEWRRRQLQFEYLIDNDPDRLRLRRGREGLITFDWTTQDSINLAEITSHYPALEEKIAALNTWLDEHKRGNEEVRAFYEQWENTVQVKSLRRVYGRDEQAIVLRYRLSAILKEE